VFETGKHVELALEHARTSAFVAWSHHDALERARALRHLIEDVEHRAHAAASESGFEAIAAGDQAGPGARCLDYERHGRASLPRKKRTRRE
jgi:hypothetical protein